MYLGFYTERQLRLDGADFYTKQEMKKYCKIWAV